jgi:hypothetical protein
MRVKSDDGFHNRCWYLSSGSSIIIEVHLNWLTFDQHLRRKDYLKTKRGRSAWRYISMRKSETKT